MLTLEKYSKTMDEIARTSDRKESEIVGEVGLAATAVTILTIVLVMIVREIADPGESQTMAMLIGAMVTGYIISSAISVGATVTAASLWLKGM